MVARELALVPSNCCPTCGQRLPEVPKAKRVCSRCHQPIRRRDRYAFDGRGGLAHHNCSNPTQRIP